LNHKGDEEHEGVKKKEKKQQSTDYTDCTDSEEGTAVHELHELHEGKKKQPGARIGLFLLFGYSE